MAPVTSSLNLATRTGRRRPDRCKYARNLSVSSVAAAWLASWSSGSASSERVRFTGDLLDWSRRGPRTRSPEGPTMRLLTRISPDPWPPRPAIRNQAGQYLEAARAQVKGVRHWHGIRQQRDGA